MNNIRRFQLTRIAMAALLADISVVLVYLIHIPMFLPFLEYDPADISILFGTLVYGTTFGLILTVLTALIQAFTVSAGSGAMGLIMHIVATGAMVVVTGLVFDAMKRIDKNRMLVGLTAALSTGALMMILIMIPLNLVVTPIFMKVTVDDVKALLIPAIIPFNAIKASINCIGAGVLYVLLKPLLKKMKIGREYIA